MGILADNITITGATVSASGSDAGIWAVDTIQILGDSDVTATGPTGLALGAATLQIDAGTVTLDAPGMIPRCDVGSLIINGGQLICSDTPPTITSISPTSGSKAGGTLVTMKGTDLTFGADQQVFVGGNKATDVTISGSDITFKTPAGTVGNTVDVVVLNYYGVGTSTTQFTYVANVLPKRKASIPASAPASIGLGNTYSLDLSTIFEDDDGDTLTYKVNIDGAGDVAANEVYTFTPPSAGNRALVFRAHDGTGYSTDTYTVNMSTTAPPPPPPPQPLPPPPPDPTPDVPAGTVFSGTGSGGAVIEVPFSDPKAGTQVELLLNGGSIPGTIGDDGKALFTIAPDALPPGEYPLSIQSPGGKPLAPTPIGTLIIKHKPDVSGTNELTILPGSTFELGLAVKLANSHPSQPVPLTISACGQSASIVQTGDAMAYCTLAVNSAVTGAFPITLSADATDTTEAIADTKIGTLEVADVSAYLTGNLSAKLGADFVCGQVTPRVPIGFRNEGAALDAASGILGIHNGALGIAIQYSAPGKLTGTLSMARLNPLVMAKAAQPIPPKLILTVDGSVNKSKKLATFDFNAQQMNRLEPGYYVFEIQAAPSGKFKGFGPLAMATIRVTAEADAEAAWTMPAGLRVSVGQQYQLVKSTLEGGTLPELEVKTGNAKVATIGSDGVLTAHQSGSAKISVRGADGGILKCQLTVVPNSYARERPLYVKGKQGLYTSTKRLYYENDALKAEVFIANATRATIHGAKGFVFELYDGERLVYRMPIDPLTFTLEHRQYGVYRLTITDEMLAGVSGKAFDLGSKRYQAVIRLGGAIPVVASTRGAAQAKPTTFQLFGEIRSAE